MYIAAIFTGSDLAMAMALALALTVTLALSKSTTKVQPLLVLVVVTHLHSAKLRVGVPIVPQHRSALLLDVRAVRVDLGTGAFRDRVQ